MKKRYIKKLAAPVIIVLFLSLYAIGYLAAVILITDVPPFARLMGSAVPAAIICFGVNALIERIKEIESGEEDDISKY